MRNIGPAHDQQRTVPDNLTAATGQKGAWLQGGAAAPDPAAYGLSPPFSLADKSFALCRVRARRWSYAR